jgi:hypothetical protein
MEPEDNNRHMDNISNTMKFFESKRKPHEGHPSSPSKLARKRKILIRAGLSLKIREN